MEDDYNNRIGITYPAIIFEHVSEEDHTLLRPIYMVLNALDVEIHNRPYSMVESRPIVFDPVTAEYTMVGDFEVTTKFPWRLLQALWSTNPARIRSMRLEPYHDAEKDKWYFRLVIKIMSLRSRMVPRTFALYLRSDKTLMRPGFDPATATNLSSGTLGIQEETEIIKKFMDLCNQLVVQHSVVANHVDPQSTYDAARHTQTQRNANGTATVRWTLPSFGGVDITTAAILWSELGTCVDDLTYGLSVSEDGKIVAIYVDVYLFSPAAPLLRLVQTQFHSFYTDPNKTDDPWKVEVTGPHHMEQRRESNPKSKISKNELLEAPIKQITMSTPSRKRMRREEPDEDEEEKKPAPILVEKKREEKKPAPTKKSVPKKAAKKPTYAPQKAAKKKKSAKDESSDVVMFDGALNDFNHYPIDDSSKDEESDSMLVEESKTKEVEEPPRKRMRTEEVPGTLSTLWNSLASPFVTSSWFGLNQKQIPSKKTDESSDSSSDSNHSSSGSDDDSSSVK